MNRLIVKPAPVWNGFLESANECINRRSEYIDVLERSLYNGALDGLSLSGDHFFYDNPLASMVSISEGNGLVRLVALQTLQDWSLPWEIIFMEKVMMVFG